MDVVNSAEVNSTDLLRDEELARAEIAVLAIILVITVLGNVAVLFALYRRHFSSNNKKLPRMYFFILHLCVADLTCALLNVLPQLCWKVTYRFHGGPVLCKVVKYGQTSGPYLSSYVLVATALDRYHAICEPLTYSAWTERHSALTVAAAWALSLLLCVPQVILFSYQEVAPGVFDCWATFPGPWGERLYVTWYSVSVFLVPLCVLLYTYLQICWTLCRYAGLPEGSAHQRLISRAKLNTVKQTVAVILLYVLCSSPFVCAQLWASWSPHLPFVEGAAFTILTLLSSLNSCVNPWIYMSFNPDLLRALCNPSLQRTRGSASSARRATEITCAEPDLHSADLRLGQRMTSLKPLRAMDSNNLQTRRPSSTNRLQEGRGYFESHS